MEVCTLTSQKWIGFLFPPFTFLVIAFLTIGILPGERWTLKTVLVCISPEAKDVEHFSKYVLVICIFPVKNYLLIFLAHLLIRWFYFFCVSTLQLFVYLRYHTTVWCILCKDFLHSISCLHSGVFLFCSGEVYWFHVIEFLVLWGLWLCLNVEMVSLCFPLTFSKFQFLH